MFTGIIDHTGTVKRITKNPSGMTLAIECRFSDVVEGESIAVDGACLTAVRPTLRAMRDRPEPGLFHCDLSLETLKLTVAGSYREGSRVNLERAMRLGDRVGGHLVSGHVDCRGTVLAKEFSGEYVKLVFGRVPEPLHRLLHKKGSVAVQGTSLTVNEVTSGGFEVMLIPHTLQRTNLEELKAGSDVNLEFDWMTKVILSEVKRWKSDWQE